ncbi:MAG: hypothetical protein AB1491_01385 [Thermodesulfobacteriota bacterium]
MLTPEAAIKMISLELSQIYRQKFGREPDSDLIREEAEDIVERFGPVTAIKEIFSLDGESRGAAERPFDEEQA